MTIENAVLLALDSGWPVTLTADEAQAIYDDLARLAEVRRIVHDAGKTYPHKCADILDVLRPSTPVGGVEK